MSWSIVIRCDGRLPDLRSCGMSNYGTMNQTRADLEQYLAAWSYWSFTGDVALCGYCSGHAERPAR